MPKSKKSEGDISVAEATRRVIKGKPSILDCLRYEIINFSALAQMIMPEVLQVCKKEKVKIDSIKMSLMRFTDELIADKEILEKKVAKILADSVLEMKNDLVVITVKQKNVISKISEISSFVEKFRLFQLIQGTDVFTILADQQKKMDLIAIFSPTAIVNIIDNQSALILISPREIVKVQGVVSYLTYIISTGQINITQIMSCHTDTIFLVDRKDALKTYNLIEEKIYFLRDLIN